MATKKIKLTAEKLNSIIKEHKFVSLSIGTDAFPYEIVSHRGLSIFIRKMNVVENTVEMNFTSGGFLGHVDNNYSQKWKCESCEGSPITRINLRNIFESYSVSGKVCSIRTNTVHGVFYFTKEPRYFYDYNF